MTNATPTNVPPKFPSPNDPEAWLIFIVSAIGDSAKLLDHLHVDPGQHRHFALPYDRATAKRYFLSRCLLDVQHATASLIRLRAWVTNSGADAAHVLDDTMSSSIAVELSGCLCREFPDLSDP